MRRFIEVVILERRSGREAYFSGKGFSRMYFVLFCLQVHEDESITEGLKCVWGGGGRGRGNRSVGAYKQQQFMVSSP